MINKSKKYHGNNYRPNYDATLDRNRLYKDVDKYGFGYTFKSKVHGKFNGSNNKCYTRRLTVEELRELYPDKRYVILLWIPLKEFVRPDLDDKKIEFIGVDNEDKTFMSSFDFDPELGLKDYIKDIDYKDIEINSTGIKLSYDILGVVRLNDGRNQSV